MGYPGDPAYLDFHKKRWPGGHRYWQVTGATVDISDKLPYSPQQAASRAIIHAEHFVDLVREALAPLLDANTLDADHPPILTAPFDAELFGHWWFEGPQWIEHLARVIHRRSQIDENPIALISCSDYLALQPRDGALPTPTISLKEGSWGVNGDHHVWLNPDTSWTWSHIYPAEAALRDIATDGRDIAGLWRDGGLPDPALATRIAQQLCRELLLMESSDWQILITTGAARDYAEQRFSTHNNQFAELLEFWNILITDESPTLSETQLARLAEIELRDSIFPDIDPNLWARRL
jgi:1,4-alpha-glucan branching enzyme